MQRKLQMLVILLLLCTATSSFGQGLRTSFYIPPKTNSADWEMLVSEHFIIYYQKDHKETARLTLEIGNSVTPPIENIIGFRLSSRLSIVVYPSALDMKQSAFFTKEHLPIQQNTGGTTEIEGSSFAIYYDGSRSSLVEQVKKGIADKLIQEMLFGGTVHERIKYATLMQVPKWFADGLCRYIVKPWDAADDDAVRDLIFRKGFFKISELSLNEQQVVGKSIWHYMAELKGEVSFQRILYLVRLTRKVEHAFYFVFNWNTNELVNEWHDYTVGIYLKDQQRDQPRNPEKKLEKGEKLLHIGFLDATRFVQTIRAKNEFTIKVIDPLTGLSKKWFKSSYKPLDDDENRFRPLWAADRKGGIWVSDITSNGYELQHLIAGSRVDYIELAKVSYMMDFDFDPVSGKFVLSVIKDGKSELWILDKDRNIKIVSTGLNGYWDLKFAPDGNSFVCVGEMTDDSVGIKKENLHYGTDIFEWRQENGQWDKRRLTHSEIIKEREPLYYLHGKISFLSDENGIVNAWSLDMTTGEKVRLTDYRRNILNSEYFEEGNQIVEMINFNGHIDWYLSRGVEKDDISDASGRVLNMTYNRIRYLESFNNIKEDKDTIESDTQKRVAQKAFFQTDFPPEVDFVQELPDTFSFDNRTSSVDPFHIKYVRSFKPDQLILQLDNGIVNSAYIPAMMRLRDALLVPIGLNFSLRFKELLGNYSLTVGARVARNFNHFDYYVLGRGSINKMPFSTNLYHQSRIVFPSEGYHKIVTNSVAASIYFWQTRFRTFQLKGELRADSKVVLSTDMETLGQKGLKRVWLTPALIYTYNNTRDFGLNTFDGIKAIGFVQHWQNTSQKGHSTVLASDFRYGHRLGTNLFWMNRLQVETSVGSLRTLYVAGGIENWLYPALDEKTVVQGNAAFIRMATSIRGFNYNVRSGNTFAILNSEIRWRILSSLLNINTRSEFMNNFMLSGFIDAGSAWYGLSPFDISNPNNVQVINSGPMVITVYNHKQPFVLGTGYGLRTNVLDYYIKFDQAIGFDNGKWGKLIKHLTVGLDF